MAESTAVEALVKAHADGNNERFYTVALTCAAKMIRTGDYEAGQLLQKMIEDVRHRLDLPPFSDLPESCPKSRCPFVAAEAVANRFMRVGSVEFIERQCRNCGFTWHEQCADAGGAR